MTDLLQRMTAAEAATHADAVKRYWKLVRDAVGGADLDPGKVLAELRAIGKARVEFEGDVQAIAERRRLAAELATLPGLEQQQNEARAQLAGLTEAFARARQEFAAASAPLRHKLTFLKERIKSTAEIRAQLIATCRDPDAVGRVERARAVVAGAVAHLDAARKKVDQQRDVADALDAKAAKATFHATEAEYRAEEAKARQLFHQYRADVTAAEAALKQAEAAVAAAEELMHAP